MAQDISITMGLDDTQVLSELNKLGTTVNTVAGNIKLKMQEVSESIATVGEAVKASSETFEKFGAVVIGIGFAEFVRGAFEAASQAVNTASSLGISTQSYMEMSTAMVAAGKKSEDLGIALSKMEIAAGKAADGNQQMITAFARVGISMDYLKTHDASETFNKIAKALADMKSPSEKALVMQELLGKGFKGADLENYVKQYEKLNGTMAGSAEATEKAAEFTDQLKEGIRQLQVKVIEIIEKLTGLRGDDVSGILGSKKAAELLVGVFTALTAGAVLKGVVSIIDAVKSLGAAFIGTSEAAAVGATATTAYTTATLGAATANLYNSAAVGRLLTQLVNKSLAEQAAAAEEAAGTTTSQAYAAAQEEIAATTAQVTRLTIARASAQQALNAILMEGAATTEGMAVTTAASVGVFARLSAMLTGIGEAIAGVVAGFSLMSAGIVAAVAAAVAVVATLGVVVWKALGPEIIDGLKKAWQGFSDFVLGIFKGIEEAFKKFTGWFDKWTSEAAAKLRELFHLPPLPPAPPPPKEEPKKPAPSGPPVVAQGQGAGVSSGSTALQDQLVNIKAQYSALLATNKAAADRLDLEIKYAHATEESKKAALAAFDANVKYNADIAKINKEIESYQTKKKSAASDEIPLYNKIIATLQQEKAALQNNNTLMAAKTAELVKQNQLQEMELVFLDTKLKVQKNIQDINNATAELTMTESEKALANINKQISAEQELALKKRQAQLGGDVPAGEADQIRSRIAATFQDQITATQKQIAVSREWSTGWKQAFNTFVDESTNAAKIAGNVFNTVTNSMNNAIDNFAKTGKFNFKSFAASVIQDLIVIEMKAQAAMAVKALMGAGGGIFGAIAGIFGFADGGDPPVGKASLVGENGPELFVPKQAGTIIPNSALGGQQTIHNNTTNNVYNISAIDSQSVAQFFASNRKMAYAAVVTAQNELPYNNSKF